MCFRVEHFGEVFTCKSALTLRAKLSFLQLCGTLKMSYWVRLSKQSAWCGSRSGISETKQAKQLEILQRKPARINAKETSSLFPKVHHIMSHWKALLASGTRAAFDASCSSRRAGARLRIEMRKRLPSCDQTWHARSDIQQSHSDYCELLTQLPLTSCIHYWLNQSKIFFFLCSFSSHRQTKLLKDSTICSRTESCGLYFKFQEISVKMTNLLWLLFVSFWNLIKFEVPKNVLFLDLKKK